MGNFKYVTNRTLASKTGEERGKIKVAVRNGSETLEGEYTCPECSHQGQVSQIFKRPISVRCGKCNILMKLPKMKGKR